MVEEIQITEIWQSCGSQKEGGGEERDVPDWYTRTVREIEPESNTGKDSVDYLRF